MRKKKSNAGRLNNGEILRVEKPRKKKTTPGNFIYVSRNPIEL